MKNINVWINRTERSARWHDGWQMGDPLELALSFQAEGEVDDLVEMVWVRLNEEPYRGLGSLTVHVIMDYHRNYPSLSVGDVVEIDGEWNQIAPVGHGPITEPLWGDKCSICGEHRIVRPLAGHLICADCAQGDPVQDLGLEPESNGEVEQIYTEGKIVVFSWGYEQTNIDYFKIVKRTPKMVTLQPIGQTRTMLGDMHGNCVPNPDRELDEPTIRRKVQVHDGKETGIKIRSYGWATLWDGMPDHWSSWH